MKTKTKTKLPKGLWVGKVRKPAKSWADASVPEYYDTFYAKYQRSAGSQFMQSLDTSNQAEAISRARLLVAARESDKWETLRAAVEGTKTRRVGVTLGAFLTAFEKVAKARKLSEYRRNMSAARLVAAVAFGIIKPMSDLRMDTDGGRLLKQVDALSFAEVFTGQTALEYARKMQGGDVINLDKALPPLVNGTINSTLGNARVVLSGKSRMLEVAALKLDWSGTDEFCLFRLPVGAREVGDDMPTTAQFREMMEAWARLADPDLALCNEMLRLFALRSGELVMARESWLHEEDGQVFLWVRDRLDEQFKCKSRNQAKLPMQADLAARLRARCAQAKEAGLVNPFLILPDVPGAEVLGEEHPQRRKLVRDGHNDWLKTFIGEVRSRKGNHRLRKFCATALYVEELADHGRYDLAARAVMLYLRHSKEATSLLHYIEQKPEVLRTMTDDMLQRARAA